MRVSKSNHTKKSHFIKKTHLTELDLLGERVIGQAQQLLQLGLDLQHAHTKQRAETKNVNNSDA